MKKNLKMVIEWLQWGAYELSIESLSRADWVGGCGAICGNDVPFKSVLSHYCYRCISSSSLPSWYILGLLSDVVELLGGVVMLGE